MKIATFITTLLVLIALAIGVQADSTQFQLKNYSDPQGRFTMDVPQGWDIQKTSGFILYMQQDLVSFGILSLDDNPSINRASNIVDGVINEFNSGDKFKSMRLVDEPVTVSSSSGKLAHAKVAFKMNGTSNYLDDMYIIADADGASHFALLTFVPAGDYDGYRSLFEAIARSVSLGHAHSKLQVLSETYRDPSHGFSVGIPDGWKKQQSDDMDLLISKGNSTIGVLKIKDDKSKKLSLLDYLPALIESLKDTSSFKKMSVVERPKMIEGTPFPLAFARVAYKLNGKNDYTSHIYIIGDPEGNARYVLTSYVPEDEESNCASIFKDMIKSFSSEDSGAVADGRKPSTVDEIKSQKPMTYSRAKCLYWVHNKTEIVKDGEAIHTADSNIDYPAASNDGNLIAYTQNNTKIVVLNLNTGKKTTVFQVAGKQTVSNKDGESESESARAVGFSADGKSLYVIQRLSSLYVGGKKLLRVDIATEVKYTIDVGIKDAAVGRNGDLLILKPGSVQFVPKSGDGWEIEPDYRDIFVNGVGFTWEDKPFYYTTDNVLIVGPNGTQKKIDLTNIDARPVITDDEAIWDDGQKIVTNRDGKISKVGRLGSNRMPFM